MSLPIGLNAQGFLFLSLLVWDGDACIGLRPHAPRVRECCSHDLPLGSQLQLHLHEELSLFYSPFFTSLYVVSSVIIGYNTQV